jgi:hypothetical protein
MKKQAEVLSRGVYVAPWLDPSTQRPGIVLIDGRGCCIHHMVREAGETEAQALSRAQALLDLIECRHE